MNKLNISPKGMSILEAYNLYRKGELIVNRKYQRKLVWTIKEKEMLIDSILKGYPLPLFLFAKNISNPEQKELEVLDGLQRLTAIFDYIENRVAWNDQVFDLKVYPAANEYLKNNVFEIPDNLIEKNKLSNDDSLEFLNYQLAITTFESMSESKMIDVFGRINSQGRQLSFQEKRQAGVVNEFCDLVREMSIMIRGDMSKEIVKLYDMPSISLDDNRKPIGYQILIEDMFWYQSGVLGRKNIRNSEDEEMIADLLCSIIINKPFEVSRENLNELYNKESRMYNTVMIKLNSIGIDKVKRDFLAVFQIVRKALSVKIDDKNFRLIVSNQNRNPVKYSFYAVFMSFYRLIIKEGMVPRENAEIIVQLEGLQSKLVQGSHSVRSSDRESNIKVVNGLIRDLFIKDEQTTEDTFGTEYKFESTLSTSKNETERFEFKRGLYSLTSRAKITFNSSVVEKILKTAVAMANRGVENTSYIFLGIADTEMDAERSREVLGVDYENLFNKYLVGIDGEIECEKEDLDSYIRRFLSEIDKYKVTEEVKSQVRQLRIQNYRGKTFIEIQITKPTEVSMFNDEVYIREGSNTVKVNAEDISKILSVGKRF